MIWERQRTTGSFVTDLRLVSQQLLTRIVDTRVELLACDTFDMTLVFTPAFDKTVTDVVHTQRRITKRNSFHESTLTSNLRTLTYELSYGRWIEMAGEMFTVSTRHRGGTQTSNSLPPYSSQHGTTRHDTARHGTTLHDTVRYDSYDTLCYGMIYCTVILYIVLHNILWRDNCYRTHQEVWGHVSRKCLKYTVSEIALPNF